MLALAEDWVKMEDASYNPYVPNFFVKGPGMHEQLLYQATTGDAREATKGKGEKIIEVVVDRMAGLLESLWAGEIFSKQV